MAQIRRLGYVCFIAAFSLAALAAPRADKAVRMSPEERLVRAAYAKMAAYNRASYAHELNRASELADELALRFELRDFHTGRIDERLGDPIGDLVTFAGGEVISGAFASIDEEALAYPARWSRTNWSTLNSDAARTVGDVFARESADTYDIGRYTSYEVTVFFEGRSRTYRAMAVFHDRFERANSFAPQFIDHVVGLAGELTDLAADQRPAFQSRGRRQPVATAESGGGLRVASENTTCSYFHQGDPSGHVTGNHAASGSFCNTCTLDTGGVEPQNHCSSVPYITTVEIGEITGDYASHAVRVEIKASSGKSVPANQPVSCESAAAAAFYDCASASCRTSLTIGLSGAGASAQAEIAAVDPTPVWKYVDQGGITCPAAQDVRRGSCTTPRAAGGGDSVRPAVDLIPYEVCYVYEEFWIVNGKRVDPPIYTQVLYCE